MTHILGCIADVSQIVIATATTFGAIVAFKVLVVEARDRKEHLQRNELRELVAELSTAIEICRAKVNQINVVTIDEVPYFHDEFSRIEAAIGIAKVFQQNELVSSAVEYVRDIREYRNGIIILKRRRPKKVDKENPLPTEYKNQRKKLSELHSKMMKTREVFFEEAGKVLGATLSDASSDDAKQALPQEED